MFGKFALTWDEFQPTMAGRFKSLLQSSEFSDVTLVAKDNTRLEAHKVILGSGSRFFKEILSHMDNHPHPLIYMMEVELEVLQSIITFLYIGKVEVKQDMIELFMETATKLQIDGLHTKEIGDEVKGALVTNESETQFNVRFGSGIKSSNDMSEMFNIKKKPTPKMIQEIRPSEASNQVDTTNIPLNDLQYPCDLCEFITDRRKDLSYHMGEKHRHEQENLKIGAFVKKMEDGLYCCPICQKRFGDPSNSRRHMKKVHYKILHFCTDCNYSSLKKAYIRDHHNSVHLGMKFPCSQCSYQAKFPTTLRNHEKSTHDL